MTRKVTSYRLSEMTLNQIKSLTESTGSSDANVIAFAIDRMYQQRIAMSEFNPPKKFFLSMWMTPQLIHMARRIFENEIYHAMTPEHKSAAEEGVACFKDAKPEYLMNLLPQDHPDRQEAFRILAEYTPYVDTPRKDI